MLEHALGEAPRSASVEEMAESQRAAGGGREAMKTEKGGCQSVWSDVDADDSVGERWARCKSLRDKNQAFLQRSRRERSASSWRCRAEVPNFGRRLSNVS